MFDVRLARVVGLAGRLFNKGTPAVQIRKPDQEPPPLLFACGVFHLQHSIDEVER